MVRLMMKYARLIAVAMVIAASSAATTAAEPLPLEYWALREAISNVQVSPDGKYLAFMKIESRDGNPILEIRLAEDLSVKPIRINSDPMEFIGLTWISDDYLIINARQKVRNKIEGVNDGVYFFKSVGYFVPTREFIELGSNTGIASLLPGSPDEVIISQGRINASLESGDPFAAFRPRQYFRFNLKTGAKTFVLKGSNRIAQAVFDDDGNPRFAQGYDAGTREFVYYARSIGDEQWREIRRVDSYDNSTFGVAAIDPRDPNKGYALAHNGADTVGLWEINLKNGQLGSLLFKVDDADVAAVATHSDFWNRGGEPVGAIYYGDRFRTAYFDTPEAQQERALMEKLRAAIPNAHNLSITTRSRDGQYMTVFNQGPKDTGSYYLLSNGQLQFVGAQHALVKPDDLSNVEFVRYSARDGRKIPAYITIPKGTPPFPAIILPHGGPYVGEVIGFDEWGQMLANNGFLVLQPEFRGSQGWGLSHYEAGLGGNWGVDMQDDKEDAAKYLVDRGLTSADRIAIFGWSYGGYAALAAATRGNDVFQCAIAGAPVSDLPLARADFTRGGIPASKQFLEDNYEGISPDQEAAKLNIPLMLVHGTVDQRVPIKHSDIMAKALDKAGKDYKYVKLKGADHFSNTLFYRHQIKLYTEMVDFLKNDCGPGGL